MNETIRYQFLRRGGIESLQEAKKQLLEALETSLPGEPLVVYYTESGNTNGQVLLGIGGTSGQSVFYNAETTDKLLDDLKEDLTEKIIQGQPKIMTEEEMHLVLKLITN